MNSWFSRHRAARRAITAAATALMTAVAFGTAAANASTAPATHEATAAQAMRSAVMPLAGNVPTEVTAALDKLEKSSQAFAQNFDKGSPSLTAVLLDKARASIGSGGVTTHLPNGAKFDVASATTYKAKSGNGPTILRLPLAGTNVAKASVLGITFNATTGAVISTSEMLIVGRENNSAQVTVWQDGVLSLNKITSAEGQVSDAGTASPTNSVAASDGFWSRLNNCLASLGIGWAVLSAITVACSFACVISAGTGCLLCILAAAGVTNANIAGCVAEASQG
ncbi:hypothetical protein [Lentzea sp. NPDC004782]|uniref:hypothetical protein n=1 Tax=Lentzea sp. NPDC004782 TaxID=3154458 RepID=UPI0033AFFB13